MKCPICGTDLTDWFGGLVSCQGTSDHPMHKFKVDWNPAQSKGKSRIIRLVFPVVGHEVDEKTEIDDNVTFPSEST